MSEQTVDLTNCDEEPIHLLGAVQPFGFLLAADKDSWRITRASQNVGDWLSSVPSELIGKALTDIFLEEAIQTIRGSLQSAVLGDTNSRVFGLRLTAGLTCDVAVHLSGEELVIECEASEEGQPIMAAMMVRGMMARLRQTEDQRSFYRIAAREMRALTGFDRVMIYRFDADGSGEVIAESARTGLESYLGLHYPASDIPRQARLLYERNWLRIIPDIAAKPSIIEPSRNAEGALLDLSMSVLRSVSPIHIEYLQNMGVGASMSVSILRQNRLWGLFACHHYSPHHVDFGRRTAAEVFGQMFSLLMENRERDEEEAYEARAQKLHNRLVTVMASEERQMESIVSRLDDIADLLACDGIGLSIDGKVTVKGHAPAESDMAGLVDHLRTQNITDIYAQHDIGAVYAPGRAFAQRAAGMLAISLSRPARNYLIFFRTEVSRSVKWAGDPAKPVTLGPLGERLTPRKSFELWKETVEGQSKPWTAVDQRIAENLRVSLLEVIFHLASLADEERRRAHERQELLIGELNHRLRNILGLIRGIISQSKGSADTLDGFTEVVGGRIQALARAHDQITSAKEGPASLLGLLRAEMGAYLGGQAVRLNTSGPDALIKPEAFATIALVFHEMVTNSAKYGALSDSRGWVELQTAYDDLGQLTIAWSEHGGPPVKAPSKRGFGTTVIERSIKHDLKGQSEVAFTPSGVKARFVIPSQYITRLEEDEAQPLQIAGNENPSTIPGDVMVLEDNVIIALDVEEQLMALGVDVVRIVGSVASALALITERPPSFALLDVNLGDETCFEVAKALADRKIPFVFASGYGELVAFAEFGDVPRLQKPFSAGSLRSAMLGAMQKPEA